LNDGGIEYPLHVFGEHNLQNIAGAREVCLELGISASAFARAISSFSGASKRLQLLSDGEKTSVYLDFAHAPSKLKATVEAMKGHYPDRKLIACMELHTYSSLNADFLGQYRGAMDMADEALVYFNSHALTLKRLPEISKSEVKQAFGRENLIVYNDSSEMLKDILSRDWNDANLLLMSSGNFDGWDVKNIAEKVTSI
jgi:UDP-N-acetylmuramate: L-alanyl-gamma-D-glutamyl-meso-diaminopimelate ligase